MEKRILMGMPTPSSNTVLEPLTYAMMAWLKAVSFHYSRFPVTEIALSESALSQFDDACLLAAATLLADANVDIILCRHTMYQKY
jgi:maleate isomerase